MRTGDSIVNVKSPEKEWKIEGYHIVSFVDGKHENPREWGKDHKILRVCLDATPLLELGLGVGLMGLVSIPTW